MTGTLTERLTETFTYDPEFGTLSYRKTGIIISGQNARTSTNQPRKSQYGTARFEGKIYPISRITWALVHGQWPDPNLVIDHINGDTRDNRITNLRLITRSENAINTHRFRRGHLNKNHWRKIIQTIRNTTKPRA